MAAADNQPQIFSYGVRLGRGYPFRDSAARIRIFSVELR